MTKTIVRIWNRDFDPLGVSGQNNAEIEKIENLLQRHLETIEKSFDKKSKEIFEKYNDCTNEYLMLTNEQAFCDGFCLGAKIISEALNCTDEKI